MGKIMRSRKRNIYCRNVLRVLPQSGTVDRKPEPKNRTQHVPNQATKNGMRGEEGLQEKQPSFRKRFSIR
jgi:hypothetical protein